MSSGHSEHRHQPPHADILYNEVTVAQSGRGHGGTSFRISCLRQHQGRLWGQGTPRGVWRAPPRSASTGPWSLREGGGLLRWGILQLGLEVRRKVPCLETIPLPQGLTIALSLWLIGPVLDHSRSLQFQIILDHSGPLRLLPPSAQLRKASANAGLSRMLTSLGPHCGGTGTPWVLFGVDSGRRGCRGSQCPGRGVRGKAGPSGAFGKGSLLPTPARADRTASSM